MRTELRITLPGEEGSADARRAVWILGKIIEVLTALDRQRGRGGGRTTWAFTDLSLGSVGTTLAPGRPRRGLTVADAEDDLRTLLRGLVEAEEREGVPMGWPMPAARHGAELGRMLGATPRQGVILGLLENGVPVQEIAVTRRAGDHLGAALRQRRYSIASLVGELEGVNTHERNVARLWLLHPICSVEVLFDDEQFEQIRSALRHRVEVGGRLERDAAGDPCRITMTSLKILHSLDEAPRLTDLIGLDPNFTGDEDPGDYLRELRG